jgi:hypothetical protein
MRDAINNNPKVQLAVIGVLILLAGVILVPSMMGGGASSSSSGTTTNTVSAQVTTPSGQTANVTVEATAPTGATSSATGAAGATGAVPPPTTVDPSALVPGQGLPAPFINAWKDGKAVVLLVVRNHGIDDKLVSRSVRGLSGDANLAVFTVRANKVARYARITQGVGVSQAPALIIVRPKRLSGSVPQAQVAYGFRDSQTVVQYVHDALYKGKDDLPYSPR